LKFCIARIGIFDFSCPCDLDLDPMTFIYEPDPYSLEIYRMCKYKLHMSRLSKVIVWQSDRHTDDRNYRVVHKKLHEVECSVILQPRLG